MEKEGNSHAEPLVSVVMATFNGARFVGAQLDSILNQSYPKLEVVIVDDHSTDNTFDILSDYARKDARIRLYRNDKNLGYVKNFERGLCLATGDFIAPSDQDDIWLPHKIEFLLQHIGDEAIAYGDSKLIDENGNYLGLRISDLKCLTTFENCLNYLIGNSAPGHGMLIRKEVIPAAIPLPTLVTHDLWIGFVATFASRVKYVGETLVLYRQHSRNVCGTGLVKSELNERQSRFEMQERARERIRLMYEKCPPELVKEKKVLKDVKASYASFSLPNNWLRMITFLKHNREMLAYKRRTPWRRWLFGFKMFVMIK